MERTLLIIKPDAYERSEEIIEVVKSKGFNVIRTKFLSMTLDQSKQLYVEHDGKPFFDRLVKFMTGSMITAVILEGEFGVKKLRDMLGDANPEDAEAGTLRATYGTNIPENAVHASDSLQAADREIRLIFGEG